MIRNLISRGAVIGAMLLLLVAPLWLQNFPYLMHLAIIAFFYAILASSWSLLAGYAGQFSFGHMGFMAIGAYTAGLLGHYIHFTTAPTGLCAELNLGPFWLVALDPIGVTSSGRDCLEIAKETLPRGTLIVDFPVWGGIILGAVMGAVFGLLVGGLVLRLRSTYLALFTIGFSEILRAAISAEIDLTQGQSGLEMVPLFPRGGNFLGMAFAANDKVPVYYVMLLLFLFAMGLMAWLAASRFGLFIRAIREDEEAAAALGVHVVRYKVLVFVITSTLAATAGAIRGHYIGIITPNDLVILQMSLVIAMSVIGGLENIYSSAIGAMIIIVILELLRTSIDIGPFTIDMTVWRLVFFGLVLMLTLRFQRNGLIAPLIWKLTRGNVAEETVANRQVASDEAEATVADAEGSA